jgi:hypothetical protein
MLSRPPFIESYKTKSLKIKSFSLPPLSMEALYGVLVGPTQ